MLIVKWLHKVHRYISCISLWKCKITENKDKKVSEMMKSTSENPLSNFYFLSIHIFLTMFAPNLKCCIPIANVAAEETVSQPF